MRLTITIVAVALLAASAVAVPVDPEAPDGIAAWKDVTVLCTSGEVFYFDDDALAWLQIHDGRLNVPIPVEQIADWSYTTFVSISGDRWRWAGPTNGWIVIPPLDCAGVVHQDGENLGDLKSMFR